MSKPFRVELPYSGPTTAAVMAASPGPGPTDGQWIYVDEFDATYRFHLADVTAVDNFRVLGHTGGAAGRWILDGDHITLSPRGGGLDDWARVSLAMAAMAYRGRIDFNAGVWNVATNQVVPNGTTLWFWPGATLVSTLAATGLPPFAASIFYNVGGTTVADTTTLSANAAAGAVAVTVVSAAGVNIGDRINLRNGLAWRSAREVINKVGNVLTLDRPLLRPYVIGNGVAVVTTCRDVQIHGNGARITGTGDSVVLFVSAWDCVVDSFRADVSVTQAFCFDVASRDSKIADCSVDGNAATTYPYLLSSSENCEINNCNSSRPTGANVYLAGCDDCHLTDGMHTGSLGSGLVLQVDNVADTLGCRGCTINGAAFVGAAAAGVLVQNNSSDNTFSGVDVSFNQAGFSLSVCARNTIVGGRARGNAQAAVAAVGASSLGNKVIGLSCTEHDIGVYQVADGAELGIFDGEIDDTSTVAWTVGMIQVTGVGSIARVSGVRARSSRAVSAQPFVRGTHASVRVYVDGPTRYEATTANGAAFFFDAGVVRISGATVIAPGGFGLFLNGATAFARIADDVDFSGAGTPFQIGAGAMNRGQVVLNGAVPVAVAFGDTNATDRFWCTLRTAGGVPTGVLVTGAPIVGTGFTVVGLAGDTSTYDYDIH